VSVGRAGLAEVDDKRIRRQAGDMLVVEPGETRAFVDSSHEYLRLVIRAPFAPGD
jgi:hypothetical protein